MYATVEKYLCINTIQYCVQIQILTTNGTKLHFPLFRVISYININTLDLEYIHFEPFDQLGQHTKQMPYSNGLTKQKKMLVRIYSGVSSLNAKH